MTTEQRLMTHKGISLKHMDTGDINRRRERSLLCCAVYVDRLCLNSLTVDEYMVFVVG